MGLSNEDIICEELEDDGPMLVIGTSPRIGGSSDFAESMRDICDAVRSLIRTDYYRFDKDPKDYPRIPPKVAQCSTRHRGRPCKKHRRR